MSVVPGLSLGCAWIVLLEHLGDEIEAIAHGGCRFLELFALYVLCHYVVPQTQLGLLDLFDRMGERFDAGGVHGLHLLDKTEEIVEPREHGFSLLLGQFETREVRNAFYIGQGQGHSITGLFPLTRPQGARLPIDKKGGPGSMPEYGKMYRPFPSNPLKL